MNSSLRISAALLATLVSGYNSGTGAGEGTTADTRAALSSSVEPVSGQADDCGGARVSPSFDCAKAASSVEEMICADSQLARLDNELTRLFGLAEKGPNTGSWRARELRETQRGWIKGRNDCWKGEDKRQCIVDAYSDRIAEVRAGFVDARTQDSAGISSGPQALACNGLDYGIAITLLAADPAIARVSWLQSSVALQQVEAASGAKYSGSYADGEYSLWTKGNEATFSMPGKGDLKCRIEEIG